MSFLSKVTGGGRNGDTAQDLPSRGGPASGLQDDYTVLGGIADRGPLSGHHMSAHPSQLDGENSIFTAVAPSELAPEQDIDAAIDTPAAVAGTGIPLIGHLPAGTQQKVLWTLLALGTIGLLLSTLLAVRSGSTSATQVGASGEAMMQSQRLAKSVSQALVGSPLAFAELKDSAEAMVQNVRGLHEGDPVLGIPARERQRRLQP